LSNLHVVEVLNSFTADAITS